MPAARPDAVLLVGFGGPEGPQDVVPFLENVTRGRGIPRERLEEVGAHYALFGGRSPINAQNRALQAALKAELADRGFSQRVYWGNRNWAPYLTEAVEQMRADGVEHALALLTSAYSSYSGCRQYREDLAAAQAQVGEGAPRLSRVRHYFNTPGFLDPVIDSVRAALAELPTGAALVFTAHSIPLSAARSAGPDGDAYVTQLREAARLVVAALDGQPAWELVFQSRSGPPSIPWLEPDVNDHLRTLAAGGASGAVLVPIGFISDHIEVLFDLDVQAAETAAELGLPIRRAATPGTDPRFVSGLADLVVERLSGSPDRPALGRLGPSHDVCPFDCCPPRVWRPAAAATLEDAAR